MKTIIAWSTICIALTLSGCGEGQNMTCVPGEVKACPCAGGGKGVQTCAMNGLSWSLCSGCSTINDAAMDGPKGDAPLTDAPLSDAAPSDGAKKESSTPDAPLSDGPKAEAGKPDAGVDGPKPDAPLSDAPQPDALQPDALQPDALQPDTMQPDAMQPDTSKPDSQTLPPVTPKWTAMQIPTTGNLNGVWGSGPTDVYVVGDGGTILHYDGRKPTAYPWWDAMTSGTTKNLHGVWGSGKDDVFAVGTNGTVLHHDGKQWNTMKAGTSYSLYTVWGNSDYSVFATGQYGAVRHTFRNSSPILWQYQSSGAGTTLRSLWGSSPTNVISVGDNGAIVRFDGTTWKAMGSGPSQSMQGLWGSSASDVFAVGGTGTILHYNGTAWKMMISKTTSNLHGVWGSGPTDVYAVGDNGTIVHYDGTVWNAVNSGSGAHLYGVWGSGPEDIFAVGYNTILHYGRCHCTVSNLCYRGLERDDTGCKICDPAKSTTALSAYTGDCTISGKCYQQGEQDSAGCQSCDPMTNKSAWTLRANVCTINGVCYDDGFAGFAVCLVCYPTLSTTAFSVAPNRCLINGQCYMGGQKDPTGCQICDPLKSTTAWTMIANKCLIGSTCYNSGDKDSTACQTCDPSKSTTAWTMIANKCLISGTCYNTGDTDPTACLVCDPLKNTKAWSTAPPPASCALPVRQAAFVHGSSSSHMAAATINTDGTGYKAISSLGDIYVSYSTYLAGRVKEYYPFTYNGPQEQAHLPYRPIYLPNGRGHVRWYRDNSGSGRVGALHLRTNGTVAGLYSRSGTSSSLFSYYMAVSNDGKYVASTRNKWGVVLMRTDGALFPNSKYSVELDTSPLPYTVYSRSITIAGDYVYAISRATSSSSSQYTLWSAPLTGKSGLTALALPKVGGVAPLYIDDEIASSADGKVIAVAAGSNSSNEDIIAINRSTATAVNVSKNPGTYYDRGTTWGYYGSGSRLALSASGTHVAYVRSVPSGWKEVEVARTDGTGTPYPITSPTNFIATSINPYGLMFVDNDNLIFTAYKSSSYGDIFRFHVPTSSVTNLTQHNGTTKPFNLDSLKSFQTFGMWLSPNKKYLYYIAYTYSGSSMYDIKAIDLSTWTVKSITSGLYVERGAGYYASCASKSTFYFVARPIYSNYKRQLYSFDMNAATPAVKLTNFTKSPTSSSYFYIYDLTPSSDCSMVAFRGGYSSKYDVYTVQNSTPPVVSQLTNSAGMTTNHYVYDYMGISQDKSQVVFFSGDSSSAQQMKVSPAVANCCKPKTIYAGAAGSKYWQLFSLQ